MEKKYKFNYKAHLYGFLAVLFMVMLKVVDVFSCHTPSFNFVFIPLFACNIFILINNLFKYYSFDADGIQCESLIKSTKIKWHEITRIEIKSISYILLFDFSILIYSKNKMIAVIPWVQGFKDLIRGIIYHYQKEENAWIDKDVIDLIK